MFKFFVMLCINKIPEQSDNQLSINIWEKAICVGLSVRLMHFKLLHMTNMTEKDAIKTITLKANNNNKEIMRQIKKVTSKKSSDPQ